jgi:hypothetical protein
MAVSPNFSIGHCMNEPKPAAGSLKSATGLEVPLRDPGYAALLAWAWPGLGHIYQRRYAKAVLFMACVLGTYFFGLALGEGKVVYASWNQTERRWQFALQAGVGLPAAPAVVQNIVVGRGGNPLLGGLMAPPRDHEELELWHLHLNQRFEMGTLYTVVAGLLNVLAIFDALWGPAGEGPPPKRKGPKGTGKPSGEEKPPAS